MASSEWFVLVGGIYTNSSGTKLRFAVSPERQTQPCGKRARCNALDHTMFDLGMARLRCG